MAEMEGKMMEFDEMIAMVSSRILRIERQTRYYDMGSQIEVAYIVISTVADAYRKTLREVIEAVISFRKGTMIQISEHDFEGKIMKEFGPIPGGVFEEILDNWRKGD